jgi:cell division septation protein DedD
MEDNKLFVFERKEVVLIFSFVIVIAVTAFILGVKTGKSLSLKEDGYDKADVEKINLQSIAEEEASQVASETSSGNYKLSQSEVEEKLRAEMEALAKADLEKEKPVEDVEKEPVTRDEPVNKEISADSISGKYTIQLYANQSKDVATDFADSFRVRGYDVIVREVSIPTKGVWYRVSVGLFETYDEAKAYLGSESALFQGEDYLIKKFD